MITTMCAFCQYHGWGLTPTEIDLLLGITPDYTVEIRPDVLEESDGPMLLHGLKELHGAGMVLPRDKQSWPDKEALDNRYQRFKLAS